MRLISEVALFRSLPRVCAFAAILAVTACSGGSGGSSSMLPQSGQSVAQSSLATSQAQQAAATTPEIDPRTTLLTMQPRAGSMQLACGTPAPGHRQCFAIKRTDLTRGLATDATGVTPDTSSTPPPCAYTGRQQYAQYCPKDLWLAYNVKTQAESTTAGKGVTIALIDAYNYPELSNDLAVFRSAYGLPKCDASNGCLKVVNQDGKTSPLPGKFPTGDDWRGETALDIDMASAMCPNCKILAVEANSDSDGDLAAAVDTAVKLGAKVVSNSYGSPERCTKIDENEGYGCTTGENFGVATDPHYDDHPGAVILASSGDVGAGPQQPASFQNVIAVGGTTLLPAANARGYTETVWNGLSGQYECSSGTGAEPCATASGCSYVVPKPSWQKDKGCPHRSLNDISAVGDPTTPVDIYSQYEGGWTAFGGTSAATPIIAGLYALSGKIPSSAEGADAAAKFLWSKGGTSAFYDVTSGNDDSPSSAGTFVCPSSYKYICVAQKGYDGPTGWGTPDGLGAF